MSRFLSSILVTPTIPSLKIGPFPLPFGHFLSPKLTGEARASLANHLLPLPPPPSPVLCSDKDFSRFIEILSSLYKFKVYSVVV